MASTYSTNLALELIGTGDQAGAWGITTNTNLGTLLEQAISGYVTQTVSDDPASPTTLTIPNGATGVARNMTIELTGALTAARNVIVPANKKLYFIYNNTTGGYAVTVKVSGQTGVSVSNGAKAILVSNGTDIVSAASSTGVVTFSSNTISTSVTNGNLNLTPSGTGRVVINDVKVGPGPTASSNGNVILGVTAGNGITSGINNTFIGNNSGAAVSTGSNNTCIGYWAGDINNYTDCTFVGFGAGTYNNGNTNTGLGRLALGLATGSAACTGVGYQALSSSSGYTGSTGLGANTDVTGSSQVQLGASGTTAYYYNISARSDARDKTDIQDTDLGLNFVMALRPVKFKWDMRDDYKPPMPDPETATPEEIDAWRRACDLSNITHDGTHTRTRYHQGLIAQEVKSTMDAMGVDFGGYQDHSIKGGQDVLSIGYPELIAPLIKAIQELKAEFDEYKRTHP